jgi:hypothetical protein
MAWIRLPLLLLSLALAACSGESTDPLGTGDDDDIRDGVGGEYGGGEGGGDPGGAGGELVTLTVNVDGDSSVQFYTHQGEKVVCGQGEGATPPPCSAQFVRGSGADIQRTLSLPREEEARFRLSAYGGDCPTVDSDVEPRGGHCTLTMDRDHEVDVHFERRAELTIAQVSPDATINFRWTLAYGAQKNGGNPLTLQGTFDCYIPGASCEKRAIFDVGTMITVSAGVGDVAIFKGWSGACAMAGMNPVCTFPLTGDSTVTGSWSYF